MNTMKTNTQNFFRHLIAGNPLQGWISYNYAASDGYEERGWERSSDQLDYYSMVSKDADFEPPAFLRPSAEEAEQNWERKGDWVFFPWIEATALALGGRLSISPEGEVRLNLPELVGLDRRRMMAEGSSSAKVWAAKAARFIDTLGED